MTCDALKATCQFQDQSNSHFTDN